MKQNMRIYGLIDKMRECYEKKRKEFEAEGQMIEKKTIVTQGPTWSVNESARLLLFINKPSFKILESLRIGPTTRGELDSGKFSMTVFQELVPETETTRSQPPGLLWNVFHNPKVIVQIPFFDLSDFPELAKMKIDLNVFFLKVVKLYKTNFVKFGIII